MRTASVRTESRGRMAVSTRKGTTGTIIATRQACSPDAARPRASGRGPGRQHGHGGSFSHHPPAVVPARTDQLNVGLCAERSAAHADQESAQERNRQYRGEHHERDPGHQACHGHVEQPARRQPSGYRVGGGAGGNDADGQRGRMQPGLEVGEAQVGAQVRRRVADP